MEAEFPFRHQFEAVLGGGIAQVIRQQRVDHHTVKGQPMAHQDQAIELGVLQRFGVVLAAKPRGQSGDHRLQGQLNRLAVRTSVVAEWDVSQCIQLLTPADADADQFSFERVEICGLRVQSHR